MSGVSDEEIARLADRMGMLVSGDGEADNAGRAVGALARRLGLSGGQLKAIFMAGAESAGAQTARLAEQTARIRALEQELAGQREALRETQREREVLRREAEDLHAALASRRATGQVRRIATLVGVLGVVGAIGLVAYGPKLHFGDTAPVAGSPSYRSAVVRDRAIVLHGEPDAASPALATLAVGAHLTVHRLLWHNLMQWIEVEYLGQTGYVSSTEVDLSS